MTVGDRKFKVLADGINYPPFRRAEKGDVVDDIPLGSLPDLLNQGAIEPASDPEPVEEAVTKAMSGRSSKK